MMDGVETNNAGRNNRQRKIESLEAEYKIPIEWADGPIRDKFRKVTNKGCYIIFVLYLLAMIGTAVYSLKNSDSTAISRVYDSSGNICGKGKAEHHPYLYLMNFKAPFKSVCISQCPRFDYNEIKYNADGSHPPATDSSEAEPLYFEEFSKKFSGLSRTKSANITPKEAFGYDEGWVNGYFTKDQFNTYTKRTKIDCLPNKEFKNCKVDNENFFAYDSYSLMMNVCIPLAPRAALAFNKVSKKFNNSIIDDIVNAIGLYGWVGLIALGSSLVFLIIIFCCTSLSTWLLLFSLALTFIVSGTFVILSYTHPGPLNSSFNAVRVKFLHFLISNKAAMMTLSVISIVLGFFTFFIMCKYRKYIETTIPILSYAAKTTLKNVLLIFLSAFTLILQIGVFFAEIYVILRIYTSGKEIRENQGGSPLASYEIDANNFTMLMLHTFGAYWLIITLNNFNDFVTAAITCNFYFQQNNTIKNLNIFCHCLGHYVGSVAWGIVLLPVYLFKLAFGWLDHLLTSDNPNAIQRVFNKILCPCCWCYENLIDRFSSDYFAMVYMGAENFWPANSRYYYLKEKYSSEAYMVSLVGTTFGFVGKLLIAFLTTYCSYIIYTNSIELQQNIDNVGFLFILAFIFGYVIGSLFINLFATTYTTIIVCYFIEKNIQENYGTSQSKCPEEIAQVMKEYQTENNQQYKRLA